MSRPKRRAATLATEKFSVRDDDSSDEGQDDYRQAPRRAPSKRCKRTPTRATTRTSSVKVVVAPSPRLAVRSSKRRAAAAVTAQLRSERDDEFDDDDDDDDDADVVVYDEEDDGNDYQQRYDDADDDVVIYDDEDEPEEVDDREEISSHRQTNRRSRKESRSPLISVRVRGVAATVNHEPNSSSSPSWAEDPDEDDDSDDDDDYDDYDGGVDFNALPNARILSAKPTTTVRAKTRVGGRSVKTKLVVKTSTSPSLASLSTSNMTRSKRASIEGHGALGLEHTELKSLPMAPAPVNEPEEERLAKKAEMVARRKRLKSKQTKEELENVIKKLLSRSSSKAKKKEAAKRGRGRQGLIPPTRAYWRVHPRVPFPFPACPSTPYTHIHTRAPTYTCVYCTDGDNDGESTARSRGRASTGPGERHVLGTTRAFGVLLTDRPSGKVVSFGRPATIPDSIKGHTAARIPSVPVLCGAPGCRQRKKYSVSDSGTPCCSLHCYRTLTCPPH
eukprot:TRINITY_DN1643_c0_g1_i1.p1 TRINITY_DN1643_c0_g1~~TRINITY_DN1643_c0_g1_i1.p1  ORF type:complete len:502 (+),score=76.97 TRINITY_DN1643_c0_g1_i1:111-1616(+)